MGLVYLLALTGGIASGKSLVASRLSELGAVHIDADLLAREVVEPGSEGLAAIEAEFGPEVIQPDGTLDRAALGAIVFTDSERRAKLNAITHPRVRDLTKRRIEDAVAADPDAVIVYDVPLLAEARGEMPMTFDAIAVVHADTETRIRRMVEFRGMTRQEAVHRLNSQASETERLAIADVVLDNNGTPEELLAQVDALWERVREQASSLRR